MRIKNYSSLIIRPAWPLGLYRVQGNSMLPTYKPGEVLVGLKWFRPKVGQVVVVQTPKRPIIKRVKKLTADGAWIEGDNSAQSTDSRHFGAVSPKQIQAVIIAKL